MVSKPAHEKTLYGYIEKHLVYRAENRLAYLHPRIVERVARMRDLIVRPDGTRTQTPSFHPDPNGQDKIVWMSSEPEPSLVPMRLVIGGLTYNAERTRAHEDEHLTLSFLFSAEFGKPLDMQSEDIKTMVQQYREKLTTLKRRWLVREPCVQFRRTLMNKAKKTRQIKKIVCFGSGNLDSGSDGAHQHLAAFAIADTLDFLYQRNPKTPPIQIVAQNPEYDSIGHLLCRELDERPITFVNEPDGLLAIDEHTLVMSVFLPTGFPLLRIVADMFHEDPAKGPAAFMCNLIQADGSKRWYNVFGRSSRKVRWMLREYEKLDFEDYIIKTKMMEHLEFPEYWLCHGQLLLKPL